MESISYIYGNSDLLVVCGYLIATIFIGYVSGLQVKNFSDYAISNRDFRDYVLTGTIFATIIGGNATYGAISQIHLVGIIFIFVPLGQVIKSLVAAKFIAKRMKQKFYHAMSMGDIFEKHYGSKGRVLCGASAAISSLIGTSAQVFAIGYLLSYFFDISFDISVFLGYGIIIFYSTFGGVNAVVKTDYFQCFMMFATMPILLSQCLKYTGGYGYIFSHVPASKLSISDPSLLKEYLSTMVVFSIFYMTPSFLQRILIAPNSRQAIKALKISAIAAFLFFIVIALIGLASISIDKTNDHNNVLFNLMNEVMPDGIRGLAICGIIAAIMSSADSALNMSSVSIYNDILKVFWKEKFSDRKEIIIVRIITLISGISTIFVALYYKQILDIIIFGIYFWSPIMLIPFYGILFDLKISVRGLFISALTGAISSLMWIFYLQELTGIKGLIPTMITVIITFMAIFFLEGNRLDGVKHKTFEDFKRSAEKLEEEENQQN